MLLPDAPLNCPEDIEAAILEEAEGHRFDKSGYEFTDHAQRLCRVVLERGARGHLVELFRRWILAPSNERFLAVELSGALRLVELHDELVALGERLAAGDFDEVFPFHSPVIRDMYVAAVVKAVAALEGS